MAKITSKALDNIWRFFAPLFIVLFGLDQVSKEIAVKNLTRGESVDFGFALSFNDGIAFGIDMPQWVIWSLALGVFGFGTWLVIENKMWRDKWHLTAVAFLLAGAMGNLVDRARLGHVVDFIKIYWWPNFNIADVFIIVAVIILAWEFLIREDSVSKI